MSERLTVFFAWQSDLPNKTNRSAILQALRSAATAVEEQFAGRDLTITLDEAVRDEPGSPNIPETIRAKIQASDVFVCDVTTINQDALSGRKMPNPNVLFELGYAVAHMDWRRVVMVFNKGYGNVTELPFDIGTQRVTTYEWPESLQETKMVRSQLASLLQTAISTIVEKSPPKAVDAKSLNPEVETRRRDIEALHRVLASIHWPTVDVFLQSAPKQIHVDVFHFWETFHGFVESSHFHLYDQELLKRVMKFHDAWGALLSHGDHFEGSGNSYTFTTAYHKPSGRRAWDEMQKELLELTEAKRDLLLYVRGNYLELDPDSLSEDARASYERFSERFDRKMRNV
jgi:hypothetical protein